MMYNSFVHLLLYFFRINFWFPRYHSNIPEGAGGVEFCHPDSLPIWFVECFILLECEPRGIPGKSDGVDS